MINSSSKKSSSVSVVVPAHPALIVVFFPPSQPAVGGHPPTPRPPGLPFRPFETPRNRAYLSNHISPPSRPSLTAPSTSGGFSIFHFSAVLAPNGSARPPSRSSPGGREEEGRGGKGREGNNVSVRTTHPLIFSAFSTFRPLQRRTEAHAPPQTLPFQYRTPRSRPVIPSPRSFSTENTFLTPLLGIFPPTLVVIF